MDYQIVTLQAKTVAGHTARTSNTAPDMFEKIGGLWKALYPGGAPAEVPGRVGENAYGLYYNYDSDVHGEYDMLAGFEVNDTARLPDGFTLAEIPAGRYARFSLVTDMTAGGIGEAWNDIWAKDLPRAYTVDFEEYLPSQDMKKAPVNIYIALKD